MASSSNSNANVGIDIAAQPQTVAMAATSIALVPTARGTLPLWIVHGDDGSDIQLTSVNASNGASVAPHNVAVNDKCITAFRVAEGAPWRIRFECTKRGAMSTLETRHNFGNMPAGVRVRQQANGVEFSSNCAALQHAGVFRIRFKPIKGCIMGCEYVALDVVSYEHQAEPHPAPPPRSSRDRLLIEVRHKLDEFGVVPPLALVTCNTATNSTFRSSAAA